MSFTVDPPLFLPYQRNATWEYVIHGTGTQVDAYNALVQFANATNLFGDTLQQVGLTKFYGFSGGEVWYGGQAVYGAQIQADHPGTDPGTGPGTVDPGWKLVGFDLNVGSEQITQSEASIAKYPSTAADYKGAIGVTDTEIEGCQRWSSQFAFTLQKRLPIGDMTESYLMNVLKPIHLHYNNATWRGFPAGTVLFHDASGQVDGGELVLTGNFFHEENVSGKTVGDITGIAKKGWEWSWTKHVEIETANKREVKPLAVYIEQIYKPANFSALGA